MKSHGGFGSCRLAPPFAASPHDLLHISDLLWAAAGAKWGSPTWRHPKPLLISKARPEERPQSIRPGAFIGCRHRCLAGHKAPTFLPTRCSYGITRASVPAGGDAPDCDGRPSAENDPAVVCEKLQISNSKLQINSKSQIPTSKQNRRGYVWNLEFGIWILEFLTF